MIEGLQVTFGTWRILKGKRTSLNFNAPKSELPIYMRLFGDFTDRSQCYVLATWTHIEEDGTEREMYKQLGAFNFVGMSVKKGEAVLQFTSDSFSVLPKTILQLVNDCGEGPDGMGRVVRLSVLAPDEITKLDANHMPDVVDDLDEEDEEDEEETAATV